MIMFANLLPDESIKKYDVLEKSTIPIKITRGKPLFYVIDLHSEEGCYVHHHCYFF